MTPTFSGSNHTIETPAAALFFEGDGSVKLHLSSCINEDEEKSIMFVADYFQYALQREDWLTTFLDEYYSEDKPVMTEAKKPFSKDDLRLIHGGLSSGSNLN